jgi:Zn-dependent protease
MGVARVRRRQRTRRRGDRPRTAGRAPYRGAQIRALRRQSGTDGDSVRAPRAVTPRRVGGRRSGLDFVLRVPGLLLAIVFHEFAHAFVANRLGDPTPRYRGRLTLNPLAHLDWLGLLMLWLFRFGWAKPVPVNPYNFRHVRPRVGMMWVAVAGPLMNVLLALATLIVLRLGGGGAGLGSLLAEMLYQAYAFNLFLAVFNLVPVPPLDGSRVVAAFSPEAAETMARIEPFGWVVLVLLIYAHVVDAVVVPLARALGSLLNTLAGVAVPL